MGDWFVQYTRAIIRAKSSYHRKNAERGIAVLFCFADFLLQTFPSRFCGSLSLWDCAENLFAPSSGSSFKLLNISLFCVLDLHRTFFFIGDHFSEIRWLKLWKNGTSKCLLLPAPISLPLSLPQSAVPLMYVPSLPFFHF